MLVESIVLLLLIESLQPQERSFTYNHTAGGWCGPEFQKQGENTTDSSNVAT